jgi:subtilase family serine protease
MLLVKLVVVLVLFAAIHSSEAADASQEFKHRAKRIPRETFKKIERSQKNTRHEVVIAVQQRNMDELEAIVLDRSTPGSAQYRSWLKHEEVGELIKNAGATAAVEEWLAKNGIEMTWKSIYGEYVKAAAPIEVWERLLNTEFYRFEDKTTRRASGVTVHRADEYSIPEHLLEHVYTIFNTVQTPPELNHPHVLPIEDVDVDSPTRALRGIHPVSVSALSSKRVLNRDVDINFLNDLYEISSNTGSPNQRQSVFQTNGQHFSPDDLNQFQDRNDIPQQAALDPFNQATNNCDSDTCGEGNLDLQFMMGLAQQTGTVFWHVEGNDPFVDYLTAITSSNNPPLVNSISWGSIEQVCPLVRP